MREIALDTETTGLDPALGDRVVEIGCVELVNRVMTGRVFHTYLNPERDMPPQAEAVHGLSAAFLADKPRFAEVVGDFLDFIGSDPLVIHNARFDLGFLNMELGRIGFAALPAARAIDTVLLARQKLALARYSLDALCSHYKIDRSERTLHGALLDARLLAQVYVELTGGLQNAFDLAVDAGETLAVDPAVPRRRYRAPRPHGASEAELAAHANLIARIKNPIWQRS
jgi:DNA polymerase III subunit epsilon